jgi:release factor glutamine methyltransferase
MYLPSDDSFLLRDSVEEYKGKSALEIGIGSGIVLKALYENFEIVAGTDISFESLRYCKDNLPNNVMLVCCDAASVFRYRFDLIVTNPPYLPDEEDKNNEPAIHGGSTGIETTLRFMKSAISALNQNGKMLIIISTLSDVSKIDKLIIELKLKRRTIREKKLFFETLTILEISLND